MVRMERQSKYTYKNYQVKVEFKNGKIAKYNATDTNRINATKQIDNYLYKRNIPYNKIESNILNSVPIVVPEKSCD